MSEPTQRFSPIIDHDEPDMALDPAGDWCWYTDHRVAVDELQGLIAAEEVAEADAGGNEVLIDRRMGDLEEALERLGKAVGT